MMEIKSHYHAFKFILIVYTTLPSTPTLPQNQHQQFDIQPILNCLTFRHLIKSGISLNSFSFDQYLDNLKDFLIINKQTFNIAIRHSNYK
jgi:hypothetical protein